jgi:hypothetical protein
MLARAKSGLILVFALAACGSEPSVKLPPHTIETSELSAKDLRLQINVTTAVTDEECEALIAKYRYSAGPGGQISVHMPSSALNGEIAPFCVENFDGKGILFNRSLF